MTDITTRLRRLGNAPFLEEAAEVIEGLRQDVEALLIENRGRGDALVAFHDDMKHLNAVVSGLHEHNNNLTRQIKEMRAEIVRLRVEAGYD